MFLSTAYNAADRVPARSDPGCHPGGHGHRALSEQFVYTNSCRGVPSSDGLQPILPTFIRTSNERLL